jgi:hypothetical protein
MSLRARRPMPFTFLYKKRYRGRNRLLGTEMAVCKLKADSKSTEIARFRTDFMANVLLYDILNDEDLQKRRVRKKVNGIGRLARRIWPIPTAS